MDTTMTGPLTRRSVAAPAVLIVEDDAETGSLLRDVLDQEGFRATVETQAERAIAVAEGGRFDAVIVDREMPHIAMVSTSSPACGTASQTRP